MRSNFNQALDITNRASEHRAYAVGNSVMLSYGYSYMVTHILIRELELLSISETTERSTNISTRYHKTQRRTSMTRYTSTKAFIAIIGTVYGAVLIFSAACVGQGVASPKKTDDRDWRSLESEGQKYLEKASECFRISAANAQCSQQEYLGKAARVYEEMRGMLNPTAIDLQRLLAVADGLRRTGRAYDALNILQGSDIYEDASAMHLMGDILYSMGDYRSAAAAYRGWIELGCSGYLLDLDDTSLWIAKKGLPRCSNLPPLLRSRLEYIEARLPDEDRGFNLPEINVPAVRSTAR